MKNSLERGPKPAANTLPTHRPLYPFMGSGLGALQRAPNPHCPRLQTLKILNVGFAYLGSGNVVGRNPLGARLAPHICVEYARASGRRAHLLYEIE